MWAVLVPPLVPSGVSPLAPACLMFAAVCLDASPPSSHHLVLGCVPSLSACPRLVPLLRFAPPSMSVPMSSRPIASRYPPRFSTRRAGRYDSVAAVLSALLAFPLGSPSHPCDLLSDGDCCLACPAPWPSSVPLAIISLANPISLPSCRLIAFPPRSLDTGDGAGPLAIDCLPVRLVRYCRSISPAVDLRGFCGGRRRGLLCLLGCRIMYVVDGVMW